MTIDPYLYSNLSEIADNPRACQDFVQMLAGGVRAIEEGSIDAAPDRMLGLVNECGNVAARGELIKRGATV